MASDKPKIQRYTVSEGAWDGWGKAPDLEEDDEGRAVLFSDVESYVESRVRDAVAQERKRCREQERDPVIDALEDAYEWFDLEVDYKTLSAEAERYKKLIASVRKIQEANP